MTAGMWIALITGVLLLLGTLATVWGVRSSSKSNAKTALDARIDARVASELERVYKRLDEYEETHTKKMSAVARILRQIAEQWPTPHGPDLDPRDLAEIEETIPPQWLRRPAATEGDPS